MLKSNQARIGRKYTGKRAFLLRGSEKEDPKTGFGSVRGS
jgi:hypothetical protein